jgi:hypothetical protein
MIRHAHYDEQAFSGIEMLSPVAAEGIVSGPVTGLQSGGTPGYGADPTKMALIRNKESYFFEEEPEPPFWDPRPTLSEQGNRLIVAYRRPPVVGFGHLNIFMHEQDVQTRERGGLPSLSRKSGLWDELWCYTPNGDPDMERQIKVVAHEVCTLVNQFDRSLVKVTFAGREFRDALDDPGIPWVSPRSN